MFGYVDHTSLQIWNIFVICCIYFLPLLSVL